MVLLANAPLYDPPPADVLAPVPHEDLRRAIVAGVPQLLAELDTDTRNVLLTFARIWTTLATGAIRAEHRPVLAHARAVYLGDEEERWDDSLLSGVRPCAEFLVRAIEDQAA